MSPNELLTSALPKQVESLTIKVVREELSDVILHSGNEGKNTVVMAGVHGNEPAGVIAIQQLIRDGWQPERGNVSFVFANVPAIVSDKRLISSNMNRLFNTDQVRPSYESKLTFAIQEKYLKNADLLLDLHASGTPDSKPFLISEPAEYNSLFNIKNIVRGLDPIHKGGSDGYMNSLGKVGLCFESGNIYDPQGIDRSTRAIINILNQQEHTDKASTLYRREQNYIEVYLSYRNISMDFRMTRKRKDFQEVKEGEIVAYDNGKPVAAPQDSYILFPDKPDAIGDEVFLLCKKI